MGFDSKQPIFFLTHDSPWIQLRGPEPLPPAFKRSGQSPLISSQPYPRCLALHFAQEFGCNPKHLMALSDKQAFSSRPWASRNLYHGSFLKPGLSSHPGRPPRRSHAGSPSPVPPSCGREPGWRSALSRRRSALGPVPAPGKVLVPAGKFGLKDTLFQKNPESAIYTTSEINSRKPLSARAGTEGGEQEGAGPKHQGFFSTERTGQS